MLIIVVIKNKIIKTEFSIRLDNFLKERGSFNPLMLYINPINENNTTINMFKALK